MDVSPGDPNNNHQLDLHLMEYSYSYSIEQTPPPDHQKGADPGYSRKPSGFSSHRYHPYGVAAVPLYESPPRGAGGQWAGFGGLPAVPEGFSPIQTVPTVETPQDSSESAHPRNEASQYDWSHLLPKKVEDIPLPPGSPSMKAVLLEDRQLANSMALEGSPESPPPLPPTDYRQELHPWISHQGLLISALLKEDASSADLPLQEECPPAPTRTTSLSEASLPLKPKIKKEEEREFEKKPDRSHLLDVFNDVFDEEFKQEMEFSHYDSTSSSSSNGSLNGSASLLSPSEKTVKCEVDNGLRLLERAFPGKEIKEEEEEEQEEKEKEKEEWDHPSEEEAGDDKMEANFQNLLKMLEVEMGPLWALEQPQAVPPQLEAPQPLLLPSPPALGKRPRFCAKCQVHNDYHLWQNCQTRDGDGIKCPRATCYCAGCKIVDGHRAYQRLNRRFMENKKKLLLQQQ